MDKPLTLWPHQSEGVALMAHKPGFILADKMGTGKTVTVLVEARQANPFRVLVIAPAKTLKAVWQKHVQWLLPDYDCLVLQGTAAQRAAALDVLTIHRKPTVVFTSWKGISTNPKLQTVRWDYCIADEAHYAKDRKSQRFKTLKTIQAGKRRALTGSPVINRPDELWTLLNWCYPKAYRSYWKFYEDYVAYSVDWFGYRHIEGPKNEEKLRREIAPFFRDIDKPDSMPKKYKTMFEVDLTPKQRKAYNQMREISASVIDGNILNAPTVLAQLTRLRQFTVAYGQVSEDGKMLLDEPSSKLDALMELNDSTSDPIVVFSQFKQAIYLGKARAEKAKISHELITGDTKDDDVEGIVERFQNGETKMLLATMQTGGIALTLTRANTGVFIDRSYSPAINEQAEDRLHRITQTKPVQIINLYVPGTVDEDVEGILHRKEEWVRKMFGK